MDLRGEIKEDKYSIRVIDVDEKKEHLKDELNRSLAGRGITPEYMEEIREKEVLTEDETLQVKAYDTFLERYQSDLERYDSMLPLESSEPPSGLPELDAVLPYYEIEEGKIMQKWEVLPEDKARIGSKIGRLKEQLQEGDYRVTKCYEASLAGEELPYDISRLHQHRQAARDEINRLQVLYEGK